MKKLLMFVAIITVVVMVAGSVRASLIPIDLTDAYPDILINSNAVVEYNATTNLLEVKAVDNQITYDNGTVEYINGKVDFRLEAIIDENGHLVSAAADSMTEIVNDSITLDGHNYVAGDVLLVGQVTQFGWAEEPTKLGTFDFRVDIDDAASDFVTNGTWPAGPQWYAGIILKPDNNPPINNLTGQPWDGNWNNSFEFTAGQNYKGDKAPVPEPATMLLLGIGVLGIAVLRKKEEV